MHRLPLLSMLPLLGCLAYAQSPSVAYRYQPVTVVAGGFITGLVASPSEHGLRYARTDIGGAYRWDDGAKQWIPLQDWLPFSERNRLGVESMAVDPSDPRRLYLAVGTYTNADAPNGALLRSEDRGGHFEAVPLPFKLGANEAGRYAGERLAVDPNHPQTLYLGTRQEGLWRSDDAGLTWSRVLSFPVWPLNGEGLTFVAFDQTSGAAGQPTPVILVGVSDTMTSLMRSNDGGETWAAVPGGPVGMFPNHAATAKDGTVYLSYTDTPGPNDVHTGAVWAYRPRTNAWRDVTPEKATGFGYGAVAVDPGNPRTVFASTLDRWQPGDTIFRSEDGGGHWVSLRDAAVREATLAPWTRHGAQQPPFGHWIGAILVDPFSSQHVLYGTGETIWESSDADGPATHWTVGAAGIEETADLALLSPDTPGTAGPHLFTGLGDIGCFRHDDFNHSPASGAMQPEFSNCDALAIASASPQAMIRVGRRWTPGPHGAVSHDGGLTWSAFPAEPDGAERGGNAAISADGKAFVWAVRNGPLAMSVDGGAHWSRLEWNQTGKEPLQVIADAREPERFWIYNPEPGSLGLLDARTGQIALANPKAPPHARLEVTAQVPDSLWMAGSTGLWHSVDGGLTWPAVENVAAAYALGFGKAASGAQAPAMYLAGALRGTPQATPRAEPGAAQPVPQGAIYRSVDGGASWQEIDDPEHRYAWIEQIAGDPRVFGRVYLGTNGRGVLVGEPVR